MKFAAAIVAYNEEELIGGCLDGLQDIFTMVSISEPWEGKHIAFDKTREIALAKGAAVLSKNFKSEKEQRNDMMERLQSAGYDYIFIIDADEFYTREGIKSAMKFIEENPETLRFNVGPVIYFWKNENWELIPKFNNIIPACYRSDMRFTALRNISTPAMKILPADIVMYHFSFAGKDDRILNKLEHFSHASEMDSEWFERVWKQWTPEMEDLHPSKNYGHRFKKAIPFECPTDIVQRFNNNHSE